MTIEARRTLPHRRCCAFTLAKRDPPAEIQLWRVGENATDHGLHRWTHRSAREVFARYEERGNPLLVDIEHNASTLEDGEPAATAGYARLELRAGAPWLVFAWSDVGAEQIATGQRRYISPEYDVDATTGEIVALYRVSLVADPATHNARVLASAHAQQSLSTKGTNAMKTNVVQLARTAVAAADENERIARDDLLEKRGGDLEPGIVEWLKTQPLAVVKSFLDTVSPAAPTSAPSTIGASARRVQALRGRDLEEFQKTMGTYRDRGMYRNSRGELVDARLPHRNPINGNLVLPTTPPREAAALLAAQDRRRGGGR